MFDDGELRLAESGAIIEYVIHSYGEGRLTVAPGAPAYPAYLFWWHFANASMVPAALTDTLVRRLGDGDSPIIQSLRARLDKAYDMVEVRLGEEPYFAGGDLTAADIMMLFPLTTMRTMSGRSIAGCPNIKAYLRPIGERPAYQRAMARSDPGVGYLQKRPGERP